MFSHAAMAAASRRVSVGATDPPIDLSLEGAGRTDPIIIGDEVEEGPPPLPYLSVSPAPLVSDVLPPAACVSPD